MATHNGTLVLTMLWPDQVSVCSASIRNWGGFEEADLYKTSDPTAVANGARYNNLPVTQREFVQTGHKQTTFVDDYYYRIHVDPLILNFGAIVSPLQEELLVWNAYFVQKTCSQIVEVNGSEWDLTGLTTPFNLAGLGWTIFTLDLPAEGSPTFEGSITFDFTDANDPVVTISGTRLILFRWRPQVELSETLQWLTDILAGKDESDEQRVCLRATPRQGFRYPLLLIDDKEQARFDAAIFGWQKRSWGLPIWPELVVHDGTINADDLTITVDATNADFRDESLAVVWQSTTQCEVLQVETVAAGSLTLSSPVQNTYTGRKLIMPCRTAQMNAPVTRQTHSAGPALIETFFAVKDNILLTGYTPPVTYKSLPVLSTGIPVDPTQKKNSDGLVLVTDYESGDFDIFSDSSFNQFLQGHLFYNDTKAACWHFRLFLHSLFGRQGLVYVPTFKDDLTLAQGFGASDTSFNIEHIGLADNMGLNALRTDLAFIFPNGTQLYRQITGITDSGATEIVTIDSNLGLAVNPGDCVICFLDKVRLGHDDVELLWTAAGENRCELDFQAVKA